MSTSLILRGILAVIVGILALAWPGVTILALIILFAVYAFMDAGFQAVRGFTSGKAGSAIGHLLLGLIDVGAGVVALAWPARRPHWSWCSSSRSGHSSGVSPRSSPRSAPARAPVCARCTSSPAWYRHGSRSGWCCSPAQGLGAVTLAILFGLFSLISGASLITRGIDVRRTERALHPGKREMESPAV